MRGNKNRASVSPWYRMTGSVTYVLPRTPDLGASLAAAAFLQPPRCQFAGIQRPEAALSGSQPLDLLARARRR